MNPRYSFSAKIFIEHGSIEPTAADINELESKVNSMASLVFGDKLLQAPDVEVIEDEDEEKDFTAYAEVQVIIRVSTTVTESDKDTAEYMADGMFQNAGDYLSINSDKHGIEAHGIEVNKVTILNVEQDSPQGENG